MALLKSQGLHFDFSIEAYNKFCLNSVWAVIMEYHRLSGLNSRNLFFWQFWRLEVSDHRASMFRVWCDPSSWFGDSYLLILTLSSWGVGAARENAIWCLFFTITLGVRASTYEWGWGQIQSITFHPGPLKFMSFLHAKHIHSIPTAPKVLTHSSINWKASSKYYLDQI